MTLRTNQLKSKLRQNTHAILRLLNGLPSVELASRKHRQQAYN
jgi:hypothetical protein